MLTGKALQLLARQPGVRVERSRCVLHRFKPAGCGKCFAACPSGAIRWGDEGLQWQEADCRRCFLCVAACPSGALGARDFALVPQLRTLGQQDKPVLACSGAPETRGHARVPCLGLMCSPELLLVVMLVLGKPLQINLTRCAACPNNAVVEPLSSALQLVSDLIEEVRLVTAEADLEYPEPGVSRRELFRILRRKSREVAGSLADSLQAAPAKSYGDKVIPERRFLLLQLLRKQSVERRDGLAARIFPAIAINASCTGCTGCVGLCPTGALLPPTTPGTQPLPHPQNCTDCGLCGVFCRAGAIVVDSTVVNPPAWTFQV
jgi:ferredoxin